MYFLGSLIVISSPFLISLLPVKVHIIPGQLNKTLRESNDHCRLANGHPDKVTYKYATYVSVIY